MLRKDGRGAREAGEQAAPDHPAFAEPRSCSCLRLSIMRYVVSMIPISAEVSPRNFLPHPPCFVLNEVQKQNEMIVKLWSRLQWVQGWKRSLWS